MKSYKPVPSHWGKPLSKFDHYCCHMLREAGCDCDIPLLRLLYDENESHNTAWCGHCQVDAELNVSKSECGDYKYPTLGKRK